MTKLRRRCRMEKQRAISAVGLIAGSAPSRGRKLTSKRAASNRVFRVFEQQWRYGECSVQSLHLKTSM